jgi:hypothetical protein
MTFQEVADQLEHVDDPDVLERAKTDQVLRYALEISRPPNWRGSGIKPDQILAFAEDSGIPVAWVPPLDVLVALVQAAPADRTEVLRAHSVQVIAQCEELLRGCDDEWIRDEQVLLICAVRALQAGHFQAAMALAVAVGEPLALWASEPRVKSFETKEAEQAWKETFRKDKYGEARRQLSAVGSSQMLARLDVLRHALIAPIPRFFTPFYARPGEEMPDTVSRHATVHQPTVEHLSVENALLAIMLGTSILCSEQECRSSNGPSRLDGLGLAMYEQAMCWAAFRQQGRRCCRVDLSPK